MKKNIFSFMSAAVLLLAVALAGCSREDANENGTRATFLKVSLAETRATTAPTGAVPATFTAPGMVLFTTSSGTIVRK